MIVLTPLQFQSLLEAMNAELERERKLRNSYAPLEDELLQRKAELSSLSLLLTRTKNCQAGLDQVKELKEKSLPLLRKKMETLWQQVDTEEESGRKYVQRDPQLAGDQPSGSLAEVESRLDQLAETLAVRVRVEVVTPELETLISVTQRALEESSRVAEEPGQSIQSQEETLMLLEGHRQKLTSVMEQVPAEVEETRPLRERGAKQLDQLSQQIKGLGEVVGRKMATTAQFVATRTQVLAQLEELNQSLEEQQAKSQSSASTSHADEPSLVALAEQKKRVEQLQDKLVGQLSEFEELDLDKKDELEELKNSVQAVTTRIDTVRDRLQVSTREGRDFPY